MNNINFSMGVIVGKNKVCIENSLSSGREIFVVKSNILRDFNVCLSDLFEQVSFVIEFAVRHLKRGRYNFLLETKRLDLDIWIECRVTKG